MPGFVPERFVPVVPSFYGGVTTELEGERHASILARLDSGLAAGIWGCGFAGAARGGGFGGALAAFDALGEPERAESADPHGPGTPATVCHRQARSYGHCRQIG